MTYPPLREARSPDAHPLFSALLADMAGPARLGWDVFGRILTRLMINGEPAPQVEIAQGRMLARARPLSATTVSRGARELVRAGLVTEVIDRSRGRSSVSLRVGGERWVAIGIHLGHRDGAIREIIGTVTELGAEEVLERRSDTGFEGVRSHPDEVLDRTAVLVAELVDLASSMNRHVLGVGVEIGGQVHRGSIVAYSNASLPCDDFAAQLADRVSTRIAAGTDHSRNETSTLTGQRWPITVILENDVNALAIQRAYHRTASRNFALVAVLEEGVGGAIIRDGQLVRGAGGAAGEVGHLVAEYADDDLEEGGIAKENPLAVPLSARGFDDACACGESRHVQCFATPARIRSELKLSTYEEFLDACKGSSRDRGQLTETGRTFRRAGRALGRGLVQFLTSTDPGELVLLLPHPLVVVERDTAGWEYREAIEAELDHGFSTTTLAARRGSSTLMVESLASLPSASDQGAIAAITCVIDAFIDHARGRDGCEPVRDAPFEDSKEPSGDRLAGPSSTIAHALTRY